MAYNSSYNHWDLRLPRVHDRCNVVLTWSLISIIARFPWPVTACDASPWESSLWFFRTYWQVLAETSVISVIRVYSIPKPLNLRNLYCVPCRKFGQSRCKHSDVNIIYRLPDPTFAVIIILVICQVAPKAQIISYKFLIIISLDHNFLKGNGVDHML